MGTRRFRCWLPALLVSIAALSGCVGEIVDAPPFGAADASTEPADAGGGSIPDADLQPDAFIPVDLPEISFDRYHSQAEIADYMRAVADAAPHLATFEVLGESSMGREIAILIIDSTGEPDPPAIFANGTHHGDEKTSTESTLAIIDYLLANRDEPDVRDILDTYAIYVLPIVNPDGHATDSRWDAYGRDPNRDYAIPGRSEEDSFHLAETRLVKELHERTEFRAALAYHAGVTGILWPWGFTYEQTDDHDLFYTLSKACADAMGFDSYIQSVDLFPAEGEYSDFAYMAHETLAVTVEVSTVKTPYESELPAIVDRSLRGTIAYMKAVHDHDTGKLALESEVEIHYGEFATIPIVNGHKPE